MSNNIIKSSKLTLERVKQMIHVVRGSKVILDYDLASLYEVETKRLNERIRRSKFVLTEDCYFKLTKEELDFIEKKKSNETNFATLKNDSATSSSNFATSSWGGARKYPYAFTVQSITTLMNILNDDYVGNIIQKAFSDNYSLIKENELKSLIFNLRGQNVMFDFDLAEFYGYETKRFNEQVKNNINKFPERYRFQLTDEEWKNVLWSKKSTAKYINKIRTKPYVFTEQGIYMLMTVLKGELATEQSIMIIDTFTELKDYVVQSNNLLSTAEISRLYNEINKYTFQIEGNTKDINKLINEVNKIKEENKDRKTELEKVMDNFINPSTHKHYLIKDGQRIEASIAYQEIYSLAKKSLFIIDDYISIKTLENLKVCNKSVKIIIFSDNQSRNGITENQLNDFVKDTGMDISIKPTNDAFHDRYIIIDFDTENYRLYFSGPSSKDAGNSVATLSEISDKSMYIALFREKIGIDIQ